MFQALVLAAHSIETTTAAAGPYLFTTGAPVQVSLADGEEGSGELEMKFPVNGGDPSKVGPLPHGLAPPAPLPLLLPTSLP